MVTHKAVSPETKRGEFGVCFVHDFGACEQAISNLDICLASLENAGWYGVVLGVQVGGKHEKCGHSKK